ncbi:hypothetical protein ZWY2020_053044 [Hordeum vulgare]|nr:hypothetical protein ZWY2020_053044 [Hordeum vulgare]
MSQSLPRHPCRRARPLRQQPPVHSFFEKTKHVVYHHQGQWVRAVGDCRSSGHRSFDLQQCARVWVNRDYDSKKVNTSVIPQGLINGDTFLDDSVINAYIYCMRAQEHLRHRARGNVHLETTYVSAILKRDGNLDIAPSNMDTSYDGFIIIYNMTWFIFQ